MAEYLKRQTFTLNYAEMNILFELLEKAIKENKADERIQKLEWLRARLYSYLS
jgi:hypothetical protein